MHRRLIFFAVAIIYSATTQADIITGIQVQQVAFTGTQNLNLSTDGVVGWRFEATESFQISALGYYDHAQNGFIDPHDVALWHYDGLSTTLIATAHLNAGTSASLVGDFRYTNISPVQIDAGEIYVIGGEIGRGNGLLEYDPTVTPTVTGWTSTSMITNVGGGFGSIFPPGSGFTNSNWPSDYGTLTDPPILGPNFMVASAVPEPTSLFFLGGLTSVAWLVRRKKRSSVVLSTDIHRE